MGDLIQGCIYFSVIVVVGYIVLPFLLIVCGVLIVLYILAQIF